MRSIALFLVIGVWIFISGQLSAQTTLPLWPAAASKTQEIDTTTDESELIAGKRVQRLTKVANPTSLFTQPPSPTLTAP